MSQIVKTSTKLWSEECAAADAAYAQDYAGAGPAGIEKLVDERRSPAYQFSNGKTFYAPKDPYA